MQLVVLKSTVNFLFDYFLAPPPTTTTTTSPHIQATVGLSDFMWFVNTALFITYSIHSLFSWVTAKIWSFYHTQALKTENKHQHVPKTITQNSLSKLVNDFSHTKD